MAAGAGIDVRIPVGGLFLVLGLIVGAYGLGTAADRSLYAPSLGVNINAWWGVVMLVFGALLLALAWRRRARDVAPTSPSP